MRISKSFPMLFVLILCEGLAQAQGERNPAVLLGWVHEKDCAVRFVYRPPNSEDFPVLPLILRRAMREDPRYGTWSTLMPEGLTQWISPEEMESLVEALEKLNLTWDISRQPISFARQPKEPPPPPPSLPWKMPMARRTSTMEIDITSDAGSAVADLPSEKVCCSMERLDRAFHIPIAVYHFRGSRLDWGCKVPGFSLANRPEPPKHGSH
jgi:hypothetical protein